MNLKFVKNAKNILINHFYTKMSVIYAHNKINKNQKLQTFN